MYGPARYKTGTGRPPFEASDGGLSENLRVTGAIIQANSSRATEEECRFDFKVRPEAFPSGPSVPVLRKAM
jgi:hypothetical protein